MAKSIQDYQAEIGGLMKSLSDLNATVTKENRPWKAEEVALRDEIMDKVQEYKEIAASMEREENLRAELEKPNKPLTVAGKAGALSANDRRPKFSDRAEFLAAVKVAYSPGGHVDPRLISAASGINETVPTEGGFLVGTDMQGGLLEDPIATGVLSSLCRRITVSGNANSTKVLGVDETSRSASRYGGIKSYWEGEADKMTGSKPKFRQIELTLKKLTGLCYATDENLQDAAQLDGIINDSFRGEFGYKIDDGIINGTGAGEFKGILNSGALISVAKETGQKAKTIVAENIIKMYARMFASSLPNAVWLVNQDTLPQLFTMSLAVGTGGAPIFMPAGGLSQSPYNTILGRPVIPIEQCATLGTIGDIIFADFSRGYIIAEKGGIQSGVSIHVRFEYNESVFRFILRADGQPVRETPLSPAKGVDTLGHFVALATRS